MKPITEAIARLIDHLGPEEVILLALDRECQRLQAENAKLRELRDAVLAYERISDTQYALGPFVGDEHLTPEFRRLLRALHATMPNEPRGSKL